MWSGLRKKYKRNKNKYIRPKIYYEFSLDIEDITLLIRLLEFSDFEINRNFKRFGSDDYDLKEIFYNYRYGCRRIRKMLIEKRGF